MAKIIKEADLDSMEKIKDVVVQSPGMHFTFDGNGWIIKGLQDHKLLTRRNAAYVQKVMSKFRFSEPELRDARVILVHLPEFKYHAMSIIGISSASWRKHFGNSIEPSREFQRYMLANDVDFEFS